MRYGLDAVARQLARESLPVRLERVDLHGHGRGFIIGAQKLLRFVFTQQRNKLFHQPLRMAVGNAQARERILRQRREIFLILCDLAQHRVDKPARGAPAVRAAKLHGLADGGMIGHLVQK